MRPGRLTPENPFSAGATFSGQVASMRPGRLTPENRRGWQQNGAHCRGFNEAGAINPGKPNQADTTIARMRPLQ